MPEPEKASPLTGPVRLKVSIEFDTVEEARATCEALKVDDDEFIRTGRDVKIVIGEITARTVDSARRSADDWLACLMAIKDSMIN